MKRHLTLTGYYAGVPICLSKVKTPDDVHAAYAPLDKPEFRETVCQHCLREYALSFDEEEQMPQWVLELRQGVGLGAH